MLKAEINGYICRSTYDYELLRIVLEDAVADDNPSMEAMNKRKLGKYVKACDNLICYAPNGEVVGACLYMPNLTGIELIHMWVDPKYRCSYGSGLLNHYLINVIGEGKEVIAKSSDISTFEKVVEEVSFQVYRVTDRARDGLKRMMANKIRWSE